MTTTNNGTRYDSRKTKTLAEQDHYNNGNYSGTTYLELASDGTFLLHIDSNGQDCFMTDCFYAIGKGEAADFLEGLDLDVTSLRYGGE